MVEGQKEKKMELVKMLWELVWSLFIRLFAPLVGPFVRALSVRRSDDGSVP